MAKTLREPYNFPSLEQTEPLLAKIGRHRALFGPWYLFFGKRLQGISQPQSPWRSRVAGGYRAQGGGCFPTAFPPGREP